MKCWDITITEYSTLALNVEKSGIEDELQLLAMDVNSRSPVLKKNVIVFMLFREKTAT